MLHLELLLEKVFKAVIVPQLMHAIEIWYPKGAVWRSKLEKVQKYFLQQYLNNFIAPYDILRQTAEVINGKPWVPIWLQTAARSIELFWKYYNGERSCQINFTTKENHRTVRKSERLHRPSHGHMVSFAGRTDTTSAMFFNKTANLWNSLKSDFNNKRNEVKNLSQSAHFKETVMKAKYFYVDV